MIPTTLFYPLVESFENCLELKLSIRSFSTFLHIENVVVVGYKPDWFTGHHIPFPHGARKERNIFDKTVECAKHYDKFIFANDDHFMIGPDVIDYYYSRPLWERVNDQDWYSKTIRNVWRIFPSGNFFDIHYPMIVEADKIPTCYDWSKEYVWKSLYCNHNGIKGVQRHDCKIPGFMAYDRITEFASTRSFISLGTGAFGPQMVGWLQDRFPEPSKFEIHEPAYKYTY